MTHHSMTNDAIAKVFPQKQATSRLQSLLQLPLQLARNRPAKSLIRLRCTGRITSGASSCCPAACVAVVVPSQAAKDAISLAFQKISPNCMLRKVSPPCGGRRLLARLTTGRASIGTPCDRSLPEKSAPHNAAGRLPSPQREVNNQHWQRGRCSSRSESCCG